MERPEYNLETRDIEGTRPNVAKDAIRTKRVTNPLDPKYKLAEVEQRPATPPKFLRDAISIDVLLLIPRTSTEHGPGKPRSSLREMPWEWVISMARIRRSLR